MTGEAGQYVPPRSCVTRLPDGRRPRRPRLSVLARLDCSEGREACWIWTGAKNSQGYGVVRVNGVNVLVHRFMFAVAFGLVRQGYDVHHVCEVRACGNPSHLQEVLSPEHRQWTLHWNQKGRLT